MNLEKVKIKLDLYSQKDGHDLIQENLDYIIDELKKIDKDFYKYYIDVLDELRTDSFRELEEIEEAISKEEREEAELERREYIASVMPNDSLYRM